MQMLRKRVGIIAAAAVVALSLAACNRGVSNTAGASGGKTPYIGIVSKGFSQTFWQAVKKGAETEAKKEGAKITFEGPPTESDVEKQITMLTNVLAKHPMPSVSRHWTTRRPLLSCSRRRRRRSR